MDLPPQVYAPETTIDGVGQGWYLRGDLGYTGWTSNDAPSYSYVTGAGPTYGNESFDDSRFGKHMSYGAGMGYQFNEFLRSDATLDFFSSDMTGSSNIASPCAVSEVAGTSCGFTHSGDFKAIGALANLYADLGTYAGITPYVGGGAGVTHVSWSDITTNTYCVNGSASCSGDTYNSGTNAGLDSWRFTYALMAGLSYDITSNMKLDFGYRFSKIAGGDMFDYSAASKALGATGAQATDEGLSRHEIRAGIRINTW
ncbi:outer membrane protein [Gellertiella hungarica]|uniref:Opacity protein-like surface antigen n=2 Tax=Gellertiella hungarica TaxID=1572859 RepID=A0A7W6J1P4_9HYPH|nr:opacity family porin [Gellertiella hungarica]MBB4063176.1 opacity protein-like surface antigen [Gellertiella hungarica]